MEKFIKKGQIIVGLDFDNAKSAFEITKLLNPKNYKLKVGSQLFTACGPKILDDLKKEGFDIFLDLKFHDTPNTVEKAVLEACKMSIWMLNIHLSGGLNMIDAAVKAKNSISPEILLIGVTVLTSLDQKDLSDIGVINNLQNHISSLISLGKKEGIDGRVFFWPLSMLPMFEDLPGNKVSYSLCHRGINLPTYHDLADEEMDLVVEVLSRHIK